MFPYTDFYSVLEELKANGKKFDGKALKRLDISQLDLACIGNAGVCRCSVSLVQKEKTSRLTFTQSDILNQPPNWNKLSVLSKIWFKLTCLITHTDNPSKRITEVISLFQQANTQHLLSPEVALSLKAEFQAILQRPKVADATLRSACDLAASVVFKFVPPEEVAICDQKLLSDYSCSSFCFRTPNES